MEHWLKERLPDAQFSPLFAIERAHWVPAHPPLPGAPPKPLLALLLSSKDRDADLQAAREMPEIKFNGESISLFPDSSAAFKKPHLWMSSAG